MKSGGRLCHGFWGMDVPDSCIAAQSNLGVGTLFQLHHVILVQF